MVKKTNAASAHSKWGAKIDGRKVITESQFENLTMRITMLGAELESVAEETEDLMKYNECIVVRDDGSGMIVRNPLPRTFANECKRFTKCLDKIVEPFLSGSNKQVIEGLGLVKIYDNIREQVTELYYTAISEHDKDMRTKVVDAKVCESCAMIHKDTSDGKAVYQEGECVTCGEETDVTDTKNFNYLGYKPKL